MTAGSEDPDDALVSALAGGESELTREELADRAEIPVTVVEALEREGLLVPTSPGRYAPDDIELLRAGRALLDAGIPLGEVLDLGRRATIALTDFADDAVDLFVRFVRDPIHATADSDEDAGRRLLLAYETLLPATSSLVGEHFRRLLLARARARAVEEQGR